MNAEEFEVVDNLFYDALDLTNVLKDKVGLIDDYLDDDRIDGGLGSDSVYFLLMRVYKLLEIVHLELRYDFEEGNR